MNTLDTVLLERLITAGVFVQGDFTLAAGTRTELKFEIERIQSDSALMSELAMRIEALLEGPRLIDYVAGVPSGGLMLADLVGRQLRCVLPQGRYPLRSIVSAKSVGGTGISIREEDRDALDGRRILVIEDVLTTGKSTRALIHALRECGAVVYAVATILTRGLMTAEELGVSEYVTLLRTDLQMTPVRERLGIL